MTTTGTRPSWSISEAAERCGVSRSTVRRYREQGKFPNAVKDSAGGWMIPLPDLLAVGWKPNAPAPEPALSQPSGQPEGQAMAEKIRELEQALYAERARTRAAEDLAASFRANAEDLRMALRMLEGRAESRVAPASEPALSRPPEPPSPAHVEQAGQAHPAHEQPTPDTEKASTDAGSRLWRRLLSRR